MNDERNKIVHKHKTNKERIKMITKRMQIEAIMNALGGQETALDLDSFDRSARAVYQDLIKLKDAPQQKRLEAFAHSMKSRPDVRWVAHTICEMEKGHQYPSLAEIADDLSPVEWLWKDWIPKGMLSLLGAVPGAGKSYVALDLARRILAADVFPDGTPVLTRDAKVLYVDAELVPQVINQRAQDWQMDRHRLFLMCPKPGEMMDLLQQRWKDELIEWVHVRRPALVMVDSLSRVSARGENNVQSVRGILSLLNSLAFDYQCGVLLIHHLRKRGRLDIHAAVALNDFRGSSHIGAISRSVLGLSIVQTGPVPDPDGPRQLEIVKSNLAPYPAPLGVRFVPLPSGGVRLEYGAPPPPYQRPSKLVRCMNWLKALLQQAGQPMKPREIIKLAEEAGFNRAMVYKAKRHLPQICNTAGRGNPFTDWAWSPKETD